MNRLDSFNDFRQPFMARGDFMFNGVAVVLSPNVPKVHAADEIIPVMPSAPIRLLRRLFGNDPTTPYRYRQGARIEHDQAFMMQGKLFISPGMWEQLKAKVGAP